jgi:uncharacterized membrane protein
MKPFIVLIVAFLLVLFPLYWIQGSWNMALAGNIAMAAMLVFTAIGHFVFWQGMVMMVPQMFPAKKMLVYLTGVLEILFAIGLCITATRRLSADLLILFFLIVLPANINSAQKSVDYQKASFDGKGMGYLWLRIPLQIIFIFWTAYFGIILKQI